MAITNHKWDYWKWLEDIESDDKFQIFRISTTERITQLWEDGSWVEVPGLGLENAIYGHDLDVMEMSPDEAQALTGTVE